MNWAAGVGADTLIETNTLQSLVYTALRTRQTKVVTVTDQAVVKHNGHFDRDTDLSKY